MMARAPNRLPTSQKTALMEFSRASANVTVPKTSGPLWSAKLRTFLPYSMQ